MSLDEVKQKTSASQFVLWMAYLEWEVNAFDKNCYYLAQIAAEIRRSYVRRGVAVRLKDFLIKFVVERRKPRKLVESTEVHVETNKAKQFFFALTGLVGSAKKGKRKGK